MTKEIWKEIEGFEGHYEISNLGRIMHIFVSKQDGLPKKQLVNNWHEETNKDRACLTKDDIVFHPYVSELVAKAFLENTNGLPFVLHLNRERVDNRSINLYFSDTDDEYVMGDYVGYAEKREYYSDMETIVTDIMLPNSMPFHVDSTLQYVEYDIDDVDEGLVVYSDVTYRVTKTIAKLCIDKLNEIGIRKYTTRTDKENYHYVTQHVLYFPKYREYIKEKPIEQWSLRGKLIKTFDSLESASTETETTGWRIKTDMQNHNGDYTGYQWKYADETTEMKVVLSKTQKEKLSIYLKEQHDTNPERFVSKESSKKKQSDNLRETFKCPITQYTLNGKKIKVYPSLADAVEETKMDRQRINRDQRMGKGGSTGFLWKYDGKQPQQVIRYNEKLKIKQAQEIKPSERKKFDPTIPPKPDAHWIPIRQYTLDGEFIKEYPSIQVAVFETGLKYHHINNDKCHQRGIASGFLWESVPKKPL